MYRSWARVWAVAASGLLAPLAGCTLIAQFNDEDAGTTLVQLDATANHHDAGKDAAVPPPDDTDAAADDATVVDSANTTPWSDPANAPPNAGVFAPPTRCNPCAEYGSVAYTCGSEQNDASGCGADDQAVYYCDNANSSSHRGYECPGSQPCFPNGEGNALCDPCGSAGPGALYAYTTSTNPLLATDSRTACVSCSAGAAVSVHACKSENECMTGGCQE